MRPSIDPRHGVFDLVVLGDDAPGAAAAAAAARLGRSVALVPTGFESNAPAAIAEPQNFVWRTLDLHRKFAGGQGFAAQALLSETPIVLPAERRAATRALAQKDEKLGGLHEEFSATESLAPAYESADAVLDDWFGDEALKTLVSVSRLGSLALGGDEPGSAVALANGATPILPAATAASLLTALRAIASEAGVVRFAAPLAAPPGRAGRHWRIAAGADIIRSRRIMAGSCELVRAAGVKSETGDSSVSRRAGGAAIIRMRFRAPPQFRDAPNNALAHILKDRATMRRARDAMLEGRIDDDQPLTAEIDGSEVIVRAAYCPSYIVEGNEKREWSGQDRQAFARAIAHRVEKLLTKESGRASDAVAILDQPPADRARRRAWRGEAVPAPSHAADRIGSAVKLALELIGDE
jgi:hypothetical protein